PELVAAHDLGADVACEVPREVVVEAPTPPGFGAHGPVRSGAGPGEQPLRMVMAERPLETLVLPGTDSVTRYVEVHDSQQLIHVFPRQVLSLHRVARRPTP